MLVGQHHIASPSGHIPNRSVGYLGDVSGHGREGRRLGGVGLQQGYQFCESHACSNCQGCVRNLLIKKEGEEFRYYYSTICDTLQENPPKRGKIEMEM